jgi:signal transduction histidine kinase/ligand-binding sensor domain-containing protein
MFRFFLAITALALSVYSYAQQVAWVNLGLEHELPDPNITALFEAEGQLYLGTSVGLYTFDGFSFLKVELDSTSKLNPYVFSMVSNGHYLFVGLRNGLARVELQTLKVDVVMHDFMAIGGASKLALSQDGSMLLANTAKGWLKFLCKSEPFMPMDTLVFDQKPKLLRFNGNDYQGFSSGSCFFNFNNRSQTLLKCDTTILDAAWWSQVKKWLLLKPDGLYIFEPISQNVQKLNFKPQIDKIENIWLYSDSQSGFWIKSKTGFCYLRSPESTQLAYFSNEPGNPYSFVSNSAQSFYTDDNGTFWVGGDGTGLAYLPPSSQKLYYLTNESFGSGHFWCFKIEQAEQLFLAGTTNGLLMAKLVGNRLIDESIYKPIGYQQFSVNAIVSLSKDEYLLSVYKAGYWTFNRTTKAFKPMRDVNQQIANLFVYGIEETGDELALYTQQHVFLLNRRTSVLSKFNSFDNQSFSVFKLLRNSDKQYLVAGGFGLQVFDSLKNRVAYYSSQISQLKAPPSEVIFDIKEIGSGKYLLATMGAGLCEFNIRSESFKRIDLVLKPENIFGIVEVGKLRYLISTSKGLCLFDYNSGVSIILNKSNILPFNDFNQSAFYKDGSKVFFGGEKGAIIFDLHDLDTLFSEKVQILARHRYAIVHKLIVLPSEHSVQLRLSFNKILPTSKLRFKYQIRGIDNDWQYLPFGQNVLTYNYLPPGEYVLQVDLIDETNFINADPLLLTIVVQPHFYETLWFKLLGFILITFILFLFVRKFALIKLRWKLERMDAERKVMIERSRISRELHDNLGSQLTYMISGLETTELLHKRNQMEKTAQNIEKLQLAARETMQHLRDSIWALHPGKMSINSLVAQYEKWASRILENKLEIEFSFEKPQGLDFEIDPLVGLNVFRIMQEAANNSIKHSFATQVVCVMSFKDDWLVVAVYDNGRGFVVGESPGTGTSTMQQRAASINATLCVESSVGSGTRVELKIHQNRLKG